MNRSVGVKTRRLCAEEATRYRSETLIREKIEKFPRLLKFTIKGSKGRQGKVSGNCRRQQSMDIHYRAYRHAVKQ